MGAWGCARETGAGTIRVHNGGDDGVEIGGGIAQDIYWRLGQCTRWELEMDLACLAQELEEGHGVGELRFCCGLDMRLRHRLQIPDPPISTLSST